MKRCKVCGKPIGGNGEGDYFSEIRLQLCPDCRDRNEMLSSRIRSKEYRRRKKQELLDLKQENEQLRVEVQELRGQIRALRGLIG